MSPYILKKKKNQREKYELAEYGKERDFLVMKLN